MSLSPFHTLHPHNRLIKYGKQKAFVSAIAIYQCSMRTSLGACKAPISGRFYFNVGRFYLCGHSITISEQEPFTLAIYALCQDGL